ncbi:hypothetical protein D1605_000630 [Xylella fastidiosa subsp. fastidiosa]|uniref:hypothetical protein n=1 Tax=Xylella fastidiosa TaxID=2371 RepID=UPI0002D828BB|nr:hypothetical protein [Xylella fastidiosa]MBE0262337.1 hypothetical protein [Xylella fastidiosa subsp. fastidiosa]MBE0264626.1 hypothetical protein [Xylella fastidiosa subsp. fastidiosa]MBE0266841.1 hypothetical protein [Xylella fastidiosa subsp. fastidiosa]MBE0270965.1 hypothetical protein [Xylella fastidiosa subsp. fastidiosa]MBE0273219.1 hypothetical protein [Xylella fastidiosa subsp. fastidiosa]
MAHTIPVANTITGSRQDKEKHNNETCTSQQHLHHPLAQQSPAIDVTALAHRHIQPHQQTENIQMIRQQNNGFAL